MVTQTTVSTDAQDYAPGSWAEITATGFDPGSIVIFQVQHSVDPGADGSWGTLDDVIVDLGGEGHEAWGVEDGGNLDLDGAANGTVVTPWYVNPDDSLNWHFLLTATDSAGQTVSAGFTDSLPGAASLDLTTSGNTGEINGALFSNVVYAAGTGLIDPFVRIQQNGSEQGYNSSADLSQQFNETAKYNTAYNKALSLGDIPVVYIYNPDTGDFSAYRQILLDINENRGGGQQYLSLDALQIYQSDSATLSAFTGSYTTTGSFTGGSSSLIYNLDANGDHWLALDFELNAGSGVGDVAVYIPDTYFTDDQFVYLYSAFGWQAESPGYKWESSDGFEEWSVSQQGLLSVSQIVGAKFIDSDQDGSWDTGESAQADVQIYLDQDLDGMLDWVDQNDNDVWDIGEGERWTTTDADGAYVFDNLAAGLGIYSTYYVREVVPEDYSQTAPGDGAYSVGVGSETATVSDGVITVVIATADEVYALPAFGNHLDFIPAPSLTIEKVVDQAEISAPGTLHYTITVTNTGNVDLTTVDLTDDLAGDEELISGDEGNDGILGVGEVWVYGATYAVTQDDINAGEDLVNVATVDTDQTEPLSDDAVTGVLWEPSLTIEKVVDQAEISAPGTLHYTITVTNTGNVDLTTVDLTDDLAGDEELISGDEGNDGILGVGEVWVYGATYAVTQDDINAGEDLVNVATVDTDQTEPLSDDAVTGVLWEPSLTIEKVVDQAEISAPGTLHYTITVTNTGNVDLTTVDLTDDLAGDEELISGDEGNDGILGVGEVWVYGATYAVTQDDINAGEDLVNVATVDTDQTEPLSDDAVTGVLWEPSLTIEKVVDQAEISAPGTLHYTITVTNTGNVDLTTVDLTDDLAGDEELISGDEGNDGILGVGEVWVYGATYAVTQDDINAGEDLVNVATVDTDQTEPLSDDAVTGVLWEPSLTIEKVVDQAEISAPGTLHYTITVTNTGNVDLTTVDLTDDLAGDEELISGDEGNDGILGVGEVWVYGATYAVTQDDINAGEDLVNVATVDTDQTEPLSDDATTSIKQLPSSLIAPTNTTVQQYLDGSALTFQEYYDYQGGVIQYSASLKTGKITQTNPGVFFYYTGASGEIKATDGTELIVTVDQTLDPADSPMSAFKTLQKNIVLYRVGDANGNGIYDTGDTLSKESSYSLGATDSDVTLTFTAKADSFYVVSVKYETNSIVGTVVGKDSSAWPTINYQFDTWLTVGSDSAEMIETYAGGVDLAPKKLTPMLLDGDQGSGARSVNEAQIKHVINAAICWWEAQGISDEQLAKLKTTTVEITDLAEQSDEDHSWMLGVQNGESLITIDDDAADHGWSLGLGGVAHDKVDLLSVLVHEMGHVLGKTDEDMGASLGVGERMLPELSTTPPDDDQVDEDPDIPSIPTVAHMLTLVGSEAAAQQMQLHMSGLSA